MHVDVHQVGDDLVEDTGHRAQMAFEVGADRLDVAFFAGGEHEVLFAAMYQYLGAVRADVLVFVAHVLFPG